MSNDGGGASRSTDPATGTSAATDVSLREYISDKMTALDRHLTSEIAALRRETSVANENAEKAVAVAREEASERLAAHNGLIELMRAQASEFASREALDDFKRERHLALEVFKGEAEKRFGRIEQFQAKIVGGILFVMIIGVANLTKLWLN